MSTIIPPQPRNPILAGVSSDLRSILATLQRELVEGIGMLQSPYLYLQAAGSDRSDGSASGIHLRWDLLRSLGSNHLPKGNLTGGLGPRYPASYGFNKTDDFVRLLRVPYLKPFAYIVNFSSARASSVVETGSQRLWRFDIPADQATSIPAREVVIRFVGHQFVTLPR